MTTACRSQPGESPEMRLVRFRTLGCYPLTGAIASTARRLGEIVEELRHRDARSAQGG